MNKWICPICGYIIENEKPRTCPICNCHYEEFEEIDIKEEQKIFDICENIGIYLIKKSKKFNKKR